MAWRARPRRKWVLSEELQASACYFRLGQTLRAALRRPGPVGRRRRPGGLLAVAALHLLPGLLSHLLVCLHPAGAAVPGDMMI